MTLFSSQWAVVLVAIVVTDCVCVSGSSKTIVELWNWIWLCCKTRVQMLESYCWAVTNDHDLNHNHTNSKFFKLQRLTTPQTVCEDCAKREQGAMFESTSSLLTLITAVLCQCASVAFQVRCCGRYRFLVHFRR